MGCHGKELREKLFDLYSANLSRMIPDISDTFRCPTCLKDFSRADLDAKDVITFGHVLPEATDGNICVLECKKCNNEMGLRYDSHAATENRMWKVGRREDGASMRLRTRQNGKDIKMELVCRQDKEISIYWPEGKRRKVDYQEFVKNSEGKTLILESDESVDHIRLCISLIHSAFLFMFHHFGYEYIMTPAADLVRKVMRCDNPPWPPNRMVSNEEDIPPCPIPALGIIREPRAVRSFVVWVPSPASLDHVRAIFLPGLDDDQEICYNNLIKWGQQSNPLENKTARYIWFTEGPQSHLDEPEHYGFVVALWQGIFPSRPAPNSTS